MTDPSRNKNEARQARKAGKPVVAADYFTVAAYGYLSKEPFWSDPFAVYRAERAFADGIICYRLGGQDDRSQNRATQGRLIGQDVLGRLSDHFEGPLYHLHRGTLLEYVGDLRIVAGESEDPDEYDQARTHYEAAANTTDSGEPFTVIDCEEQNDLSIGLFNQLIGVTDTSVEPVPQTDAERTLSEWVDYKEHHLPGLMALLLDRGIDAYSEG